MLPSSPNECFVCNPNQFIFETSIKKACVQWYNFFKVVIAVWRIEVIVISIDFDRRKIDVSIKRLTKTPELEYFDLYALRSVDVEVDCVIPDKGIVIKYPGSNITGFIHWFEIGWGSVGRFELLYKKGDIIKVKVSEFDAEKNRVKFSIKRQYKHQFDEWNALIKENESVRGKVVGYFENSAQVELSHNGYIVQAFVLRKFISNYAFVEYSDMPFYLPIGETFHFFIFEINEDRKTISLSRTEYLESEDIPEYGEKRLVKYVKSNHSKGYFYSNELEGWTTVPEKKITFGSSIEVIPVAHGTGEFEIV